jgi:predicted Zn-dependent protease
VNAAIGKEHVREGGRIERDSYLRRVDGTVFGPDPREGFFRDNVFYHPELAFQVEFPRGFETQNQKQAVGATSPDRDAVMIVTLTGRASADAAAREFFAQSGIERGDGSRRSLHGLPASRYEFAASAGQVPVRGLAAFVEHNGRVFQLLGYSASTVWSRYDGAFEDAIESFGRLGDRRYLNVEPARLKIVPASRMTGLDELARRAPVDRRTLLLINGVTDDDALQGRSFVKTVVGDELVQDIFKDQQRRRASERNES